MERLLFVVTFADQGPQERIPLSILLLKIHLFWNLVRRLIASQRRRLIYRHRHAQIGDGAKKLFSIIREVTFIYVNIRKSYGVQTGLILSFKRVF